MNTPAASWTSYGFLSLLSLGLLAPTTCDGTNPGEDGGTTQQCFGMALPPRAVNGAVPPAPLTPYYPTTNFNTATPAQAGMDAVKLEQALTFTTAQSRTQGILILRHGYIVAERYFSGFTAQTRHESYSMAKGFSSALVGIAIGAGLLPNVDDRACKYYPLQWNCANTADPRSRITIKHLMNIQSGLQWSEDWRSNATSLNDTILGGGNLVDYALAKPAVTEPGTTQRYSTGDPALLTGPLQSVAGKTVFEYAKQVLLPPLGLSGINWNSDLQGRTTTYAGIQATMREFAKFGYLYLRRGMWGSQQVVPASWVDLTTKRTDVCQDRYKYLWHVNPPVRLGPTDPSCSNFPNCTPLSLVNVPGDGFFAEGVFGQFIFVFPSADLVIVRLAQDGFGAEYWDEYARGFLTRVFDSFN